MSSNSVTTVTYNLKDIDDIICHTPDYVNFQRLDVILFATKNISKMNRCLPLTTRPYQLVNYLISYFEHFPIEEGEELEKYRFDSGVAYFLDDLCRFSRDSFVRKLLQIPNIKLITTIR
jgi:hypothetical protein